MLIRLNHLIKMGGSNGLIQRKLLWSSVLGLVITFSEVFLLNDAFSGTIDIIEDFEVDGFMILVNYIFAYISIVGVSFAIVSLVNVIYELVTERSVSIQVLGIIGGLLF